MKPLLCVVLMLALCFAGCSVPDDPEWNTLGAGIRQMPPPVLVDAKRWAANRDAWDYFDSQDIDQDVFRLLCTPKAGGDTEDLGPTTVREIRSCLERPELPSYEECIIRLIRIATNSMEAITGAPFDCRPKFMPQYQHEASDTEPEVPDNWNPKLVTVQEIERDLVQSPVLPRWVPIVVIGGIVVVGGLLSGGVGWLPALCTLQAGSGPACPGDPAYPPGATPQPDKGGGT